MFSALPLFWTAGLNTAMGSTLAAGGCWVMQETFEPGAALALMARERVTEPYSLTHQTRALAEHPDWATTDLSALRCVYGKARTPVIRWRAIPGGSCRWGGACRDVRSSAPTVRHAAQAGRSVTVPCCPARLRVVDPETGKVLGVDDEGELCVSGATRMLGYLGRSPEECFDEDGFFPPATPAT
jgi:acyl-CoA synthetase (AMP-forming)/AMP-acid ligase II